MSDLAPHVDLYNRKLTDSTGANFVFPQTAVGDRLQLALRFLRHSTDGVSTTDLGLRGIKASIGATLQPPSGGGAKLRFGNSGGDPETTEAVAYNASADTLKTALTGVSGDWTPEEVVLADTACWLVRFTEQTGASPLQVGTVNTLTPKSLARVRAYLFNGVWWHEVRFIQAPLAFTSVYERILPPPPSVLEVRAGGSDSSSDDIIVNELQELTVPANFRGTYDLAWGGRRTVLLGIQDGPDTIATALNAMWTDGQTRFNVTNPDVDKALIEFIGPLGDLPQALIVATVKSNPAGTPTLELDLNTAEMASAMRVAASLDKSTLLLSTTLEIELEYVPEGEDPDDDTVASQFLTVQQAIKIVRDQIYPELETVAPIDWLRKPVAVDYVPFDPNQVVTGQQYYLRALGNGSLNTFVVAHNRNSSALLVAVRENISGGRLLDPTEYAVVFDDDNQLTITVGGPPPATGALQLIIACPLVASALRTHTHSIAQVTGLQTIIDDLTARILVLEAYIPTGALVNPAISSGVQASIDIPDFYLVFPNSRLAANFDPFTLLNATAATLAALPRPPGLLPAIHAASVTTFSTTLPGSPSVGTVYQNTGGTTILLPGAIGRRGTSLLANGFAGWDGRAWYRLTHAGTSTSYFPTDFEQELIPPISFEADTWQSKQNFQLEFDLALQLLRATSNAQWDLAIEWGTAPSDTSPSTTTPNLQNVVWNATPILTQRLIVSKLQQKRHFGCLIQRAANDTITAKKLQQTAWSAGDSAPSGPAFVLRVRLIRFDTENSIPTAVGYAFAALTSAKCSVG